MKKILSTLLAAIMLCTAFTFGATAEDGSAPKGFTLGKALYAHAVSNSTDGEAWSAWQAVHDEHFSEAKPNEKYFFLPSSAGDDNVDVYNGFSESVTVNSTAIPAGTTANVKFALDTPYTVKASGTSYTLRFLKSSAEAAIYVNNSDADGGGTELMTYLNGDKSRSAKAAGAIVTPDGKIDNTAIKKIKGRGNTTWGKAKKPYNITYADKVSIAGMSAGKKFSLLANYQDDSLSRNRFLYDLSDAVGMPYASDSRYVDFYSDGYYWGSFQLCEKVEVGKNSLVGDFEEKDYLTEEGEVKDDFPFLCEVDAGATDGEDYYVQLNSGLKITIKAPELEPKDKGYDEVKNYVKEKFEAFYGATANRSGDLSQYADVDSLAKMYLINELGKNWDSGVSSLFFTYKQDSNGDFRFFASPVWDYDNSLGNAVGIESDLKNMGVTDYEKFTGLWCRYKGKSAKQKTSPNIIARFSLNSGVMESAKKLWFDKFVPAIEHFAGVKTNDEINKEFYTSQAYYSLVKGTADMNYKSGWKLRTSEWVANHNSLTKVVYDSSANTYTTDKDSTFYPNNFDGMYNYCRDWFICRAAWLSKEFAPVKPEEKVKEEEQQPTTQPVTEPAKPKPVIPEEAAASISLKSGKTYKISKYKSVKNTKSTVATVKNGKIVALKKGTAKITLTFSDSSKLVYTVKVTSSPKIKVNGKKFSAKKTYSVKKGGKLAVTVSGKAASINNSYKSTKSKTAKVVSKKTASKLKIKGLKKGKATVTIKVNGVSFKIKVKVK